MATIVKSFGQFVDLDEETNNRSRLDRARILVGCNRLNTIPREMDFILGGDIWNITLEVESNAKKKIAFDDLPAASESKERERPEKWSPPAPPQPRTSDLAIFRWAKDKRQVGTVNNGDKEHVTDMLDGDNTVQANSTCKGKSSHAWPDTNPRGSVKGTGHKEENIRARTEPMERWSGARSNQKQIWIGKDLETREAKRSKGEKQYIKDNSMSAMDCDKNGEGNRRDVRSESSGERTQTALEFSRDRVGWSGHVEGTGVCKEKGVGRPIHIGPGINQAENIEVDRDRPINVGPCFYQLENKEEDRGQPMDQDPKPMDKNHAKGVNLASEQEMHKGKGQFANFLNKDNKENPIDFSGLQEAISAAMKEAMAVQLRDWFPTGQGINRVAALKLDHKEDTIVEETALEESGSRESHVLSKNERIETKEKVEGEREMETGSYTRVAIEACEQLSREREREKQANTEKETEVVSPVTTRAGRAKQRVENNRMSTRQYQKRGGKACTRGEVVAQASKRKEEHMSPGMHFTILDFLSDDALLHIAKSCGVSFGNEPGEVFSSITQVRDTSRMGICPDL